MLNFLGNYFDALPRKAKQGILITTDAILLPLALWVSLALRLGDWWPPINNPWVFLIAPIVAIPIFARLGLYRAVVRYMGVRAVYTVILGVSLSSLLFALVVISVDLYALPRSVHGIYWATALLYIGGSRFIARHYFLRKQFQPLHRIHVAIYGAGASGTQLAMGLLSAKEYLPVAFIDDDISKYKTIINGIRVYKANEIPKLIRKFQISQVLLAMPSINRTQRKAILNDLEPYPLHVKTIPGLADLVSGNASVDDIREVDIEDLLGRDPIPPDEQLLSKCIHNKSVLVTGAGGSIGSELCRQIVSLAPAKLVLYELSEYALYKIHQELSGLYPSVEILPVLGSITNEERLRHVVTSLNIQTVYHAAAYKHVPLVESNPLEGIRNNVFGTLITAQVAKECQVDTFVLISTDKAVRPTSVMGASKRLAELIIQALAEQDDRTLFSMVRFGNVLGSSGSVVPLFREQIKRGGPITVTHPEINRYFMTIPEAAQLVIQAGAMANGGDVFVLDMAEPVKIVDLAKKMVHLCGLEIKSEEQPYGDIAIHFTGLRPGEKLYEELLIEQDKNTPTLHPRITRAQEAMLHWDDLHRYLMALQHAIKETDVLALRSLLLQVIQEYQPQCGIEDPIWQDLEIKTANSPLSS